MKIKEPLLIFISTKAFTWGVFIAVSLIFYMYGGRIHSFPGILKEALECWDGGHYRRIIEHGYEEPWLMVFFPLFPMAAKAMMTIIKDPVWAGAAVSNICLLVSSIYFYNLTEKRYNGKTAVLSLVFFMCAPTALFYITTYTESLFFMLTVMGFYCLDEKKWAAAAFCGMLSAACRNAGILFAIPFIFSYYAAYRDSKKELYMLPAYLLMISAGLISYMAYSKIINNDYIAFLHGQSRWYKEGRVGVFPFYAYLMHLKNFTVEFQPKMNEVRVNLSFIYMTAALLLLYFGHKLLKLSEKAYFMVMLLFFSIVNSTESIARYLSAVFPLWVLLALWVQQQKKERTVLAIMLVYMLVWQVYMNFRWTMNYWVN